MPTPSTSRQVRIRRALATSAAAFAVILASAACGYAAGSPARGDAPASDAPATDDGYESSSYGGEHGVASHPAGPVVVPVGSTKEPDAPPAPADKEPDDQPADKDDEDKEGDEPADEPATTIDVLGTDCSGSDLKPHDGFQKAPRCVSTAAGEVAANSPSLLITSAPARVKSGEAFPLTVSIRNLVRDRFLKAADGGYYAESSFLNPEGLQRGHFHTACRMLASTDVAPDAEPVPGFFVATEDKGGGAKPDSVTVTVTGLKGPGIAQCAVWAGDGSHRVPMMVRANQTPAFDVVRITVK